MGPAATPAFTELGDALIEETDKVVAGQQEVATAVKNLSAAADIIKESK